MYSNGSDMCTGWLVIMCPMAIGDIRPLLMGFDGGRTCPATSHRQLSHKQAEYVVDTNILLQSGLELRMWEAIGFEARYLILWDIAIIWNPVWLLCHPSWKWLNCYIAVWQFIWKLFVYRPSHHKALGHDVYLYLSVQSRFGSITSVFASYPCLLF